MCCLKWRNLIPLYAHYILLYTNSCHFDVYYTYYFHGNITDTHAMLLWKQQVYPSAPVVLREYLDHSCSARL